MRQKKKRRNKACKESQKTNDNNEKGKEEVETRIFERWDENNESEDEFD